MRDLKFRRQHPIPPYVADFCCIEKKLIVELDVLGTAKKLTRHELDIWSARVGKS